GVPTIPTTWIEPHDPFEPPQGEFVIKPSISAGGRSTARYDRTHWEQAAAHVRARQHAGQTGMVQPYLRTVDDTGELDLIFIDGAYSHAVRKRPTLRLGEGVVERPWERMAWAGLVAPTPEELEIAERTMVVVSEHLQERTTYGRVDLVSDVNGGSVVLE